MLIGNVYRKISSHNKILTNTIWLLIDKIARLVFGLFVGVWVARYLGPELYGRYSYSISFVLLFSPITTMGLNYIVTRDLVNKRFDKNIILGSVFIIRVVGGLLSIAIVILSMSILRPNDIEIIFFVGLLSLGQAMKAITIIDYWFQAHINSFPVVISRISVLIITNCAKIYAIYDKADIKIFILITFIELFLSELILLLPYTKYKQNIFHWKISKETIKYYIKSSLPLILSGFASIIYLKIDIAMIGQYLGDSSVGIYAAASKISEIWYIIPTALMASIFPKILESRKSDQKKYYNWIQLFYFILALSAYFISIVITLFNEKIILLVFGEQYIEAASILAIHIWACVFIFMRALFSKWILAENKLYLSLLTQGGGALINILANIVLIPLFGISGAAYATVLSYAFASYLILFFNKDTIKNALMMTKALLFPILIFKWKKI